MNVFERMSEDLRELVQLVRQDEQYMAEVKHGAIVPTDETARAHRQRAARIQQICRDFNIV